MALRDSGEQFSMVDQESATYRPRRAYIEPDAEPAQPERPVQPERPAQPERNVMRPVQPERNGMRPAQPERNGTRPAWPLSQPRTIQSRSIEMTQARTDGRGRPHE